MDNGDGVHVNLLLRHYNLTHVHMVQKITTLYKGAAIFVCGSKIFSIVYIHLKVSTFVQPIFYVDTKFHYPYVQKSICTLVHKYIYLIS